MVKLIIAFIIVIFLSFIRCETTVKTGIKGKKQNVISSRRDYDTINSISSKEEFKTYRIKGRSLIFFMLSQREYLQVLKHSSESDRYDLDNLFNSFKLNAFAFKNILEKEKITSDITTARNFEIEQYGGKIIKFDRSSDDQIIGQILSDGITKPRFEFGMISPKEMAEMIEDYFKIPSVTVPVPLPVIQQPNKIDTIKK
jgi:hypothetical protein